MRTLIRAYTRHVINAILQVFQCIFINGINRRALQICLIIITKDSNRTKSLNHTEISVCSHEHDFTPICLIVFHIAVIFYVLCIQIQGFNGRIGDFDDIIILFPYFINPPKRIIIFIETYIFKNVILNSIYILLTNRSKLPNDPVHTAGTDFGIYTGNGLVHIFKICVIHLFLRHFALRLFIQKIITRCD